jgi:hypothetical protein
VVIAATTLCPWLMFLAQNPKPLTAENAEKFAENAEKIINGIILRICKPKACFGS